jgi:hypothetical protein
MPARPSNTYRAARKRIAKANHILWRYIPLIPKGGTDHAKAFDVAQPIPKVSAAGRVTFIKRVAIP